MAEKNCTITGHIYGHSLYNNGGDYEVGKNFDAYAGYVIQDDNQAHCYAYIVKFTTPTFDGVSENIVYNVYATDGHGDEACTLKYAVCSSDANRNMYLDSMGSVDDPNQIVSGTVSFPKLTSEPTVCPLTMPADDLVSDTTYYLILWTHNETGVSIKNINNAWGTNSISLNYEDTPVHTHTYSKTVISPTCTSRGYTKFTCSCGDTYNENYVEPLGHMWDSVMVTTEPTHESTGIATYGCSRCNGEKHEIIERLVATIYIDNGMGLDEYGIFIDNGSEWESYMLYIDNGSSWEIYC